MKSKIERALREEELKSERMAIVIQLILITGLFFVYLFSPKGFDSTRGTWFEPVKLVFAVYLPILCIRAIHTWKSKRISIGHYIYLLIDIVAVTVLIFSYHIQYQRPFSLSLHAPTFLYYFVFIVLRCLSYDPLKVISVGAFCSIAWMAMAYYGLSYSSTALSFSWTPIWGSLVPRKGVVHEGKKREERYGEILIKEQDEYRAGSTAGRVT